MLAHKICSLTEWKLGGVGEDFFWGLLQQLLTQQAKKLLNNPNNFADTAILHKYIVLNILNRDHI